MKICLALDIEDKRRFIEIVKLTKDHVDVYKIGPVALSSIGVVSLEIISCLEKEIFVDLKFYDIPSVVRRSIKNFCSFGAKIFTVHVSAGEEIFRSAVEEAKIHKAEIAGVTMLTSENCDEKVILERARRAFGWQASWVVAPPKFSKKIKSELEDKIKVISPGIRISPQTQDDHKEYLTPSEAVEEKVDMIVVGRPVIYSESPQKVLQDIKRDIKLALKNV